MQSRASRKAREVHPGINKTVFNDHAAQKIRIITAIVSMIDYRSPCAADCHRVPLQAPSSSKFPSAVFRIPSKAFSEDDADALLCTEYTGFTIQV